MSELLLNFFVSAFGYSLLAVTVVGLLERRGWLRDGAIAEMLWRSALYFGLIVAFTAALRQPMTDLFGAFSAAVPNDEVSARDIADRRPPPALSTPSVVPVSAPQLSAATTSMPVLEPAIETSSIRVQSSQTVAVSLPESTAKYITFVIALLLLVGASAMGLALWRRQRFLRDALAASQAAAPGWHAHVSALDGEDLYPVIRSVPQLASPLCGGAQLILLPTWCDTLDRDAQRALLAHELAHLRRRDPMWRLLDNAVVALLLGLPPFRFAARRLEALAELACDAEAARRSGEPRALAECLAQCLEHHYAATPRLAVAMAADHGGLVERVQRLLEERPMFTAPRFTVRRSLVAAAVAIALIVPMVAISVDTEHTSSDIHITNSSSDLFGNSMSATITSPGRKLEIESDGAITFTPNEDDIATLSAGGEFELRETKGGVKRALEIESVDGKLVRDYRVDGSKAPFDGNAKQWLAATLPDLFRSSGFDAEARAKRIFARSGVDGLLAEITSITSDYARATYLGELFKLGQPNATQVERALTLARAIESDHELRRALSVVLESDTLSDAAQDGVLAAAGDLGSDYERAELLVAASKRISLDGARLGAWQAATAGIASDHEQRRVLEALLGQRDQHPERALLAITMAEKIDSDYEKRMLLASAEKAGLVDTNARSEYTRVATTIGSDYERRQALLELFDDGEVDARLTLDVLNAARDLGSDYETKELLVALAKVMPNDANAIAVYRSIARGLATFERGEAEQALDRFSKT